MTNPRPAASVVFVALLLAAIGVEPAFSATVHINYLDSSGEGFFDPTPVTPVTGNPGTTLGAQRMNAFQAAADRWAVALVSPVTIVIDAQMNSLNCEQNSGTLGQAGPRGSIASDFPGAPAPGTWFPQALANSILGYDIDTGSPDIAAEFNKDVGTPGCLESAPWSYVIGVPEPQGTLAFSATVFHEFGHGLGFLTFATASTGEWCCQTGNPNHVKPDHFGRLLLDETPTPTLWPLLTDTGRRNSAIDTGNLTWSGSRVAEVAGILTNGQHPSGRVRMYAPSTLRPGSSVSHWDVSVAPTDIMEPFLQSNSLTRLTNHLMLDVGWNAMVALAIGHTDGLDEITAGSATGYTITIANDGPADITVAGATVTDTMPAALTGVTWTCSGSGGATCGVANGAGDIATTVTLPLGGEITFDIGATVDPGFTGTLGNTVTVGMPARLQNTLPASATDTTTVVAGGPSPGIAVSAISGSTTEAGGAASFTVVLEAGPTDDVTIGLTSSDTTEGTVSPAGLTFTAADWDTPKVVTVTGVDDAVDDGNVGYAIVTAPASSADSGYDGLDPPNVPVVNLDDDTAGIAVSAISGNTSETGDTATFTVVLQSEPTASVTIGLASADPGEGTVAPSQLTFTPLNWAAPQQATVSGVDDAVDDGDVGYSIQTAPAVSGDAKYANMNATDVAVTNLDDDTAGVTVSAISGDTTEGGGTATFTVVLDTRPTSGVTVPLSSGDMSEGTVSPPQLVFSPDDWSEPQQATVTGVDDDVIDGDVAFQAVTGSAVSADANYGGMNAANVTITNLDDDTAGVTLSVVSGDTTESGGTATFTLALDSQPSADVTIGLSSSDTTEGTLTPAALVFAPGNWSTPQLVTVTGVDDEIDDGDVTFTIVTAPAVSEDPDYDALDLADIGVTNVDDDTAGISATPASADTAEWGRQANFTVVLDTEPVADVTVPLTSTDPTEGSISPAQLTFTPLNWSVPQPATVTGVDDAVEDGDVAFAIEIGPAASADGAYEGLAGPDVPLVNLDDDFDDTITQDGFESADVP